MVLQRIILSIFFLAFFLKNGPCAANNQVNDSILFSYLNKGINYLAIQQITKNADSSVFEGEWPSYIYNINSVIFLGKKGKSAYDSNVFNTLFVHNTLAELYFFVKDNAKIIPILVKAQKNFKYYKNENSFNFWPELSRPEHLKCKHKNCKQRRPVNFKYQYAFINNYANIFDDADDTMAAQLAYYYSNKVKEASNSGELLYYPKAQFEKNLINYRDVGARKTNWYNKKLGFNYRTGAYLTWFGADWKHSHFFTWFFPYHSKQNIIYGQNEIDCVVNANILRTLYICGDTTIAGVKESKDFLRKAVLKDKCFTCGVYYPTEFSFHYAMAKAISSGVNNLDDIKDTLVNQICKNRNASGYWNSQMEENDLQATLYAVNSLLLLESSSKVSIEIEKAMDYIMHACIKDGDQVYWKGGVFFSGGTAMRYEHVWKSDAYTTCLALEAIANYLKLKSKA